MPTVHRFAAYRVVIYLMKTIQTIMKIWKTKRMMKMVAIVVTGTGDTRAT